MFLTMPSVKIAQMVVLLQNKTVIKVLDKKYHYTTFAPELVVQIQYNFIEMFLMMPFSIIAY